MRESGAEPIVADGLDIGPRSCDAKRARRGDPPDDGLAGVTSLRKFDAERSPPRAACVPKEPTTSSRPPRGGRPPAIAQSYGLWYYEGADDRLSVETDRLEPIRRAP